MKLIVGDDHPIFGALLCELLTSAGHDPVGMGLDVPAALAMCEEIDADACILGLGSTPLSDLDDRSGGRSRRTRVIVLLLAEPHPLLIRRARLLPVSGIATKDDDFDDLLRVVTAATGLRCGRSEMPLSPCARAALRDLGSETPARSLTRREEEILRHLAAGQAPAAVAQSMGIRLTTVRSHIASVFHKLGAHRLLEAVTAARRLGLLEPGELDTTDGRRPPSGDIPADSWTAG